MSMRDDFFVESADSDHEARRVELQERAKALARERQRQMMFELSRQAQDQYQDDILDTMEDMEVSYSAPSESFPWLIPSSTKHCQTSAQSISKPRFNGS